MPKDGFNVELLGLEELRDSINPKRINKNLSSGIGEATKRLHTELKFAVQRRYSNKFNLDTVLVGKSTSLAKFGSNVIRHGLQYRYKPIGLSKFPYTYFSGNIPPLPKKRPGMVHKVEVRRGVKKLVYGKNGQGGFVPRSKDGTAWRSPSGKGAPMLERVGKGREPLTLLFGPSLSQMAEWSFDSTIDRLRDSLEEIIIDNIKF